MSGGDLALRLGLHKLLDPYDLKARYLPGLLVLLPAILCIAVLYGAKSPMAVTLTSVLTACGGPYLLASFVRTWGQHAQDRLFREWGGQPSTILLRHRDEQLPPMTKRRYGELSALKLGIHLPTAEEEAEHPQGADQAYAAAADTLRPLTNDRKTFTFVFKELVAYGFNRNAHGSRWVGLAVALLTIAFSLVHAGMLHGHPPYWTPLDLEPGHASVVIVAAVFCCLWCFHFTARTVKQSGFAYAKRLWEALEKVPKKRASKAGSN
ncbi:hypothetical protein EIP75_16055 [Aquabacterium soli]|uniref:Uncharacterized protein n=1 Tax=Aquabacterium soli TaxID=2493092 RepID=A0A3R8YLY8_9BURK|nr:hypothetical protein [Aquabacterium soli]RRS03454.1 hypothetical protein EIP75_16055 [Aquabacterium soli]